MAQAAINGLRLYGVAAYETGAHEPFAEGTSLIPFRALAAVVSPSRYARTVIDETEMNAYTRVLEEVQSITSVLPAPPGTVFRTRDHLARWLELHYFTLTQAMGSIEGHAQARLTVVKSASVDPKDATAGDAKENAKQLQAMASQSMRVLRGQAAATINLTVPDEETTIIARASFLVETERWGVFSELSAKEDERHTSLDFHLTGPWPAYDFVQMKFGV